MTLIDPPAGFSTKPGFVNRNDQEVLGPTGKAGTDHGQSVYVLRCRACDHVYGANGSDIALRLCPTCGGGRPGFDVTEADVIDHQPPKSRRNPNWTRDELILALDLYFDEPMATENIASVVALSALLNRFWAAAGVEGEKLRNPAGVSMKLGNFQGLDPQYLARGRKGLPHGARADEEIWNEFSGDRGKLRATAAAIRATIEEAPEILLGAIDGADADAAEGAVLTRLHRFRERDSTLAKTRKAQELKKSGRLVCEACDFDFAEAFGERGLGYIEVHHTRALETLKAGDRTKLSELALLCANCHRMVHAKRPWLSVEELRLLVRAAKGAPGAAPAQEA
jgi:5-methylcytosine-specific restriction protein A